MSHPTLGLPPRDVQAGFPDAAERIRDRKGRLAAIALEAAAAADATLTGRHGELGLRRLLRDVEVMLDRVALCVAGNDAYWLREWADWTAPVFRRRRVPMDDLVNLAEGVRSAVAGTLSPVEMGVANVALDEAVKVFRWYRRLAGDARRRNRLLHFIYKGA